MKKLKVLLSVIAMSFVMIGCGSSSSDSIISTTEATSVPEPDTTSRIVDDLMDISGVLDIDGFLDKYYEYVEKDTYETTEEWLQKRDEVFAPIYNEIVTFIVSTGGQTYDADTTTGEIKVNLSENTFESSVADLNYTGAHYNVFWESENTSSIYIDTTTRSTRSDGYIFDNVSFDDDLVSVGNGSWTCEALNCVFSYNASPSEASEYSIMMKLSVLTNSSEIEHYYDTSFTSATSLTRTERNSYPGSLVSIIIYDWNTGKELGKLVAK